MLKLLFSLILSLFIASLSFASVTSEIRDAVKKAKSDKYMGVSVAIMYKGKLLMSEGYGYSKYSIFKRKRKQANGNTIYRLASISKAISGTLGYILRDKGEIDLEDDIQTILPGLPNHHNYVLKDLLSNRSGVRHYKNLDPLILLGDFDSAWNATKRFMKDPLVDKPYNYSTHGYTIFAAAVEKETKQSFCSNILEHISSKHGFTTLKCENRWKSNDNRSKLYKVNWRGKLKSILFPDNLSWKYAGGGLESSANDLVKFLNKLNQFKILSGQSVYEMTTRPDSFANYAFGWDTGRIDGDAFYAKSGSQDGATSYMRTYPDRDLHIVILANTKNDGFSGLATDIAKIILD